MWEASHGKVLTIDNLRKRDICVLDWCYLCRCDAESVDHILLHCLVAKGLWSHMFSMLNLPWIMPSRVAEVLMCWKRKFDDPTASVVWKIYHLVFSGVYGGR